MKQLFALALVFVLSGCASLGSDEGQQLAARIGVQYATLKVIGDDADRAATVVSVIDSAIELVEGGDALPIDLLEAEIRDVIPFDKLDQADTLLVELLILQVREELDLRVDDGLIDPEKVAKVLEVLTWVRDAAALGVEPTE
jgi:uncharacterized protein YceK